MSDSSSHRKGPSPKDNPNYDLCEMLMELSSFERDVSRNVFKSNAYRSAASALAAYPTRVISGKEASKIKGIGKKIAEKIEEFLTTGKLQKLEKIRTDDTSIALTQLTRVSGIGPAKARQLFDAGIKSVDDLKKHKDNLTHHQIIGLKYVVEFEKKIPRAEMKTIEETVRNSLSCMKQKYIMTVCGSYRRGKDKSGDIDILLTYKNENSDTPNNIKKESIVTKITSKRKDISSGFCKDDILNKKIKVKNDHTDSGCSNLKSKQESKSTSDTKIDIADASFSKEVVSKSDHRAMLHAVVEQLRNDNIVTDTLSLGDTKFMGVCKVDTGDCHRRIDIRLLAPENYTCGVLYFTGSDLFNKGMRTEALEAGFTLNEYNIRPKGSTGIPGEPLPVTSEQDIFDYIGMKYKTPSDRNI